jgi:hypothetical protein
MRKQWILFVISLLIISVIQCSRYSVTTEISKSSKISQLKSAGLVIRISTRSKLTLEKFLKNVSNWLGGYKPIKGIYIVTDSSDKINYYSGYGERFYQITKEKDFLKYKSIGIISTYLRGNSSELKKIISENNLDGLIIYEIYNVFSSGMQFMDFDSVIVITDKDLNILYMDYQSDGFETHESDDIRIAEELLNKICERLLKKLIEMDFLEELDI